MNAACATRQYSPCGGTLPAIWSFSDPSSAVNKELIDPLLTAMLQSGEGVSDLLFAVGKPPVVEQHGSLEEFPVELPEPVLSAGAYRADRRLP